MKQLVAVWLLVSFFFVVQNWADVDALNTDNPDNLTRLHQIESLANGQGWYDLTIDRIGINGVDMHWSRHVDVVATPIYKVVDLIGGQHAARVATLVAVPLIFLFAALWAVGGIARALSPHRAAPLFAMGLFGATAGNFHLQVGRIDHHGLHLALVMFVLYFFVASTNRWAHAIAGFLVGVTLTSSLETVPILAAFFGAVGLLWLLDQDMARQHYINFGVGSVAGMVVSGLLLAPPGRLVALEGDVFSLPFVGLFGIPALGLAAVGGRDWPRPQRIAALGAIAVATAGWVAAVCLDCIKGPYGDVPDVLQDEWLLRIQEITPLLTELRNNPGSLVVATASFVAGLIALVVRVKRRQDRDDIVLLVMLGVATVLAFWQIRGIPLAQAMAAPVTGGLVAGIHHRVASGRTARLYRVIVVVAVACFPLAAFVNTGLPEEATCQSSLDNSVPPGRVLADMTFSSEMLLPTGHSVTASSYHRGYEGVLDIYEIFTADADTAQQLALDADADYIATCSTRSFVQVWGEDNPGSLSDDLLNDRIPSWLTPLTEEPAVFYAISE